MLKVKHLLNYSKGVAMTTTTPPTPEAQFLYDDGCPMCKGYTSIFTGLGWADRAGFSTVDETTLADLDLDRARHFIPLHDPKTGAVRYGLDGILALVGKNLPAVERFGRTRPVRATLEAMYWLITYNRRHIVAAAPPATGFDCAPDFRRAPVITYLMGTAAITAGITVTLGLIPFAVPMACAGLVLAAGRDVAWAMEREVALGHAATATLAGVGAAAIALTLGAPMTIATTIGGAVGARKLWLRRWMLRRP